LVHIKNEKAALAFQFAVQRGKFILLVAAQKSMTHRLSRAITVGLLLSAMVGWSPAGWSQDGSVRQRVKDRQAQRQPAQAEAASVPEFQAVLSKPGDYRFSFQHKGLSRMYRVHLPASYKPSIAVPLLFALHGGGGNMDYQADDTKYGLISKSEQEGFAVVFPNGYSKLPGGKLATWNAGNCCAAARDEQVDDVGFIREVLTRVSQQVSVDYKRIYATGMSNGAMMAYRLACEMSEVFSGIAAVAGTDNTRSCAPEMPVSVLHIHAKNDSHVLFNGGAGPDSVRASQVTDFVSVANTIVKWTKQNACALSPKRTLESPAAFCQVYAPCAGGSEVQLCVTETGGHSWPGGEKLRGNEPPSQAISAVDVMWDFFKRIKPPVLQTQPSTPASAPVPSSQSK
jgi:polyhydroxybutyrate depolymerase